MKEQATDLLTRLQRLNKQQILDRLKEMDPTLFEHLVALLFELRGYQAETVGKSGDEGVDVRLQKGKMSAVAQCKRYADSVGQPTVRDLYGTMLHNNANEAYLVTTAQITRQAKEWAFGKPINFVDGFALTEWIVESASLSDSGGFSIGKLFRFGKQANQDPKRVYAMSAAQPPNNKDNSDGTRQDGARFWFWPLVVLGILLFGIAIGVAYNRLSPRWAADEAIVEATPIVLAVESDTDTAVESDTEAGGAGPDVEAEDGSDNTAAAAETATPVEEAAAEATVENPTETPTESPTEVPTALATDAPTEAPTEVPTETPTEAPTLAPTATWTPIAEAAAPAAECDIPVDSEFQQFYSFGELGCPTTTTGLHWAAWEVFERGYLLWRSDSDVAYALYGPSQGTWFAIPERWDGTTIAPRGEPPSTNLVAPTRGFGYVWGIRDDIFENLGWATDIEKGFCALIQPYDQGFILQSIPVDSCTADGQFNQARSADWQPITIIASANGQFIIR